LHFLADILGTGRAHWFDRSDQAPGPAIEAYSLHSPSTASSHIVSLNLQVEMN
jgi:hypothetical protein